MFDKLTVNCNPKNLVLIRDFVQDNLKKMEVSDELTANQIVLAVDEACANSMIHANHCSSDKCLSLEMYKETDDIYINLYDFAPAFDLNQYEMDNIVDKVKRSDNGGMGVCLIKRIMDEIFVERHDDFCVYRFIKHLKRNMS